MNKTAYNISLYGIIWYVEAISKVRQILKLPHVIIKNQNWSKVSCKTFDQFIKISSANSEAEPEYDRRGGSSLPVNIWKPE